MNMFKWSSSVHAGEMGENVVNGAGKAVMYNDDGEIVIATVEGKAIGLLVSSTENNITKGDAVSFLVKDVGVMTMAGSCKAGDYISVNESGDGIVATAGKPIFGRAFSSGVNGGMCKVMICPCGAIFGG